jgi:hypothetical protein
MHVVFRVLLHELEWSHERRSRSRAPLSLTRPPPDRRRAKHGQVEDGGGRSPLHCFEASSRRLSSGCLGSVRVWPWHWSCNEVMSYAFNESPWRRRDPCGGAILAASPDGAILAASPDGVSYTPLGHADRQRGWDGGLDGDGWENLLSTAAHVGVIYPAGCAMELFLVPYVLWGKAEIRAFQMSR